MKKYIAELIGTFTLVFFGCGSAIFMGDQVGMLGVSFAFGISVVAMAYSIGHISGAHLNPAVSLGVFVTGGLSVNDLVGYVIGQVAGGVLAALALLIIAEGRTVGFDPSAGFAANGWSDYGMLSALIFEVLATAIFLVVILGATQEGAPAAMAGLAIGLTLVMIHIVGIAITGVSVNPARSIGPALIQGGTALEQLWLFIVAPLAGGAIGGVLHQSGITSR
ncbi:MAG: aquaporin [Pseudomonadota bacterium]